MPVRFLPLVLLLVCQLTIALDLDDYVLVDLSHTYDETTLFWPTSPTRFEKETLAYGKTEGGWFYSSFSVCTPEHGGTHLDAPIHFHEGGQTTDQIGLQQLITEVIVIDVSERAAADSDYQLSARDVSDWEATHGRIEAGATVLMRTGWSKFWPDAKTYLGDDTPGDASKLHFPGFGEDAARLLVRERGVAGLGVDTASIDHGQSKQFLSHQVAAQKNVLGLENLTGLDALPERGALLIALPMKIGGGSGGPARVVALVPAR
jgi:kynurenine formamidase